MQPQTVFSIANAIALVSWLLLLLQGRKRWVSGLVSGVAVPLLFALVYTFVLLTHLGEMNGSFNSLSGVSQIFANPWFLLIGWVHYLAFDLFVGSWEVRDAQSQGIPHWMVIPCLLLTFLFGPVGFLLYYCLRLVRIRTI